jgi:hypothetical protein
MDAQLYTEILEGDLLGALKYYGLSVKDGVFQQDKDPKHKPKLALNWLKSNGVEVLDWPPQSPALNPIEHLWAYLKRRLAAYKKDPTSMHQLWERIEEEWEDIPQSFCIELISSMPSRIAAVLEAKGGYTKY